MKKQIPNAITLLNALCGCIAVVFAMTSQFELTALFVFLGIFFDFFDGLAARTLKVQSELGLQLDSLADMITSGLVPGLVMFQLIGMSLGMGFSMDLMAAPKDSFWDGLHINLLPFVGFLITLGSCYRLANFNIDENQTSSFIGLPTPANTLLIVSLPLILLYQGNDRINDIILNEWFLIGLTLCSCYILNAKIPLFALKFKNWSFKDNALRYIFLLISGVLIVTLKFVAIPVIIVFYIISSVISNITSGKE